MRRTAFIVKNLEQIKSVPKLIEFLDAHPVLTEMCGFKMGSLPDETQFYRFLRIVLFQESINYFDIFSL